MVMEQKAFTVGTLAERAGVNLESIRFYERRGLLPEPSRAASGYRIYGGDDLRRLEFIKKAQGLGFTLNEIKELLSLRVDGPVPCDEVRGLAERKLGDVDRKIRDLQQIQQSLTALVGACRSRPQTNECPILEALDSEDKNNEND